MGTSWLTLTVLATATATAAVCLALLIRSRKACARLQRRNAALSEHNRALGSASAAKSRFVTNMSHEMRTPLNAVIGFAELLHERRAGQPALSPSQREHLEIIRCSGDHLLTLVNEVLDLARIEAGHMRLLTEPVEPVVVAEQCLRSLRPFADEKLIVMEMQARALGTIDLDPARLRQVILNFLSNALRFTPTGGRVTLTLARDGARLLVAVNDTGVGISDEDRQRVFEEFVQVGSEHRGGSGLGLAVTKQIVEAQGGEVTVTSVLGGGSTFYAWLPWVPVTRSHVLEPRPQSDPLERRPDSVARLGARGVSASLRAVRH